MTNFADVHAVDRKGARSGRVSYADPIVLHETSRRQVLLVRFFIKRSFGTDIALRIVTYRKARPPFQWNAMEAKSLSLPEDAARRLLGVLKEHFAVAEGDEDGSYMLVRLVTRNSALMIPRLSLLR